jgi:hypothetical protein
VSAAQTRGAAALDGARVEGARCTVGVFRQRSFNRGHRPLADIVASADRIARAFVSGTVHAPQTPWLQPARAGQLQRGAVPRAVVAAVASVARLAIHVQHHQNFLVMTWSPVLPG